MCAICKQNIMCLYAECLLLLPMTLYFPGLILFRLILCSYGGISFAIGQSNGNPLQYSCLENPTDGGAWWAAVHGVMKSPIGLGDFTFPFHFHALEKEMVTNLAWRNPGTGEPGGLLSMGSHRVRHHCSNLAAAAAFVIVFLCTKMIFIDIIILVKI